MNKYVYMSTDGEKKIHLFYDKVLADLAVPYNEQYIETSFWKTHMLIVGSPDKPSIFTVHGGNGINPLNLKLFLPLLEHFCIYAPDVIGFPGKSEPIRMNPKDDSYGIWLKELLEKLNISSIPFIVSSYSSAMLLTLAKVAREKIAKAVLLVPSGIAHGSIFSIVQKQMLPFMTYSIKPTDSRLKKAFKPMLTEEDAVWYDFFHIMLTDYKMEMRAPREFSAKEMERFKAPLFIIASNEDIFFPANRVFPKADKIFHNIKIRKTIDGKHLPSPSTMNALCEEIADFLLD